MYKIKNRRFMVGLSVLVVTLVLGTGVYIDCNKTPNVQSIENMHLVHDYNATNKLSEMAKTASLIVVGKYTTFNSAWNMARNESNISEEDPDNYVEGHLYSFDVSEALKGDLAETTILVNHRYSELNTVVESNAVVNSEGVITKEATKTNKISFTIHDPLYIEPEIGATYVLFLLKDENFGNYYGAIEPFSIKFEENDIAALQSNLINRTSDFKEVAPLTGSSRTVFVTIGARESLADSVSGLTFDEVKAKIVSFGKE